jgi:hypothetical protein
MFARWQNQRKIESKLAFIENGSALCNSRAVDAPLRNRRFSSQEWKCGPVTEGVMGSAFVARVLAWVSSV